jgi:hypothetical protein
MTDQPAAAKAPDPAAARAQADLAKSNAQKEKILAENKEREKWMPTPTQAENDAAAMGQPVEKKPDGSPVEAQTRQMEAETKKPGYQTRAA